METKEELVLAIKSWVKLDNEIRSLQKEVLKRNNEKKKISTNLIEVMKKHEIDCFDIKDGQIMYNKKTVKKPMTKKVLLEVLSKYFQGDFMKANEFSNIDIAHTITIGKAKGFFIFNILSNAFQATTRHSVRTSIN